MNLIKTKLHSNENYCDICHHKLFNHYVPLKTKRNIKTFLCKNCLLIQSISQKKFQSHPKPSMSIDADRSSIMYTKTRFLPRNIVLFKKFKINFKKFDHILDIGSNRGSFVDYLKTKNKKVKITAIESKKNIFNHKKSKNMKFINDRFEDSKILSNTYDFVYCVHTLEHFVSCFKSLSKIYNSLKINGTAFIVVPNMNYYTKDSIVEYFIDTHTFHFTNNVLVSLFNKIGFKILKKDEKSDITYYLQKPENKNHYKKNNLFLNKSLSFFDEKDALIKYKKNLKKKRDRLKNFGKKLKEEGNNFLFWGAGRIFDGLFKYGNIKFSLNYKLYDKHLNKYFKKFYNLKLLKKDELKKLKNYKVVICSNSEYSQIADDAKSFNFKKVMSYERFLK